MTLLLLALIIQAGSLQRPAQSSPQMQFQEMARIPVEYLVGPTTLAILIQAPTPVFNGNVAKKEVTYQPYDNGSVFATVTFTDDKGATLDGWPGGHFLSDDELAIYASGKREVLDVKFVEYALGLIDKAKQAAAQPIPQPLKVEVTAQTETKAAEQQAEIDAAK